MEMNDQILQHIMNVQTQLLQQMVKQQQDVNMNNNNIAQPANTITPAPMTAFGTPLPSSIASPVTPPPVQNLAQPGMPLMSVNDPTRYGTYAAPYQSYGSRQVQAAQSGFRNFIGGTIDEMKNFDATQHSKESIDQYFSQQSRGIQEQAVGILGGAIGGSASVGSFFIPGGIASSLMLGGAVGAGVGFASSAMVNGAKTALDYQDLLQKQSYKFINAFESTSDMGGIGLGTRDRQQMSGFLRDLADDKFLKDSEMMTILDGAAGNNLLKSVSDVESFKKKFTDIVDTVKTIAVTMNQTLEEATGFMGEMERRGISTKDMSMVSSQAKVMSSFMGIDAKEGAQLLFNTTDAITQGTSLDPYKIFASSSETGFYASHLQAMARENDPALYHYMKNSGGDKVLSGQYEQLTRGYVGEGQGKSMLLGLFASGFRVNDQTGDFEVDEAAMDSLLTGNLSRSQMQDLSSRARNKYTDSQLFKLSETSGVLFNEYASSQQLAQFMQRNVDMLMQQQADLGNPIDEETALRQLGIASNVEEAKFMEGMIDLGLDENMQKVIRSRNLKEDQDSNMISESPGLWKRGRYWIERNITNPLFGDTGQSISDAFGRSMQSYQKFITGIDDSSVLGGDASLQSFDTQGLKALGEQSKRLIDENQIIGANAMQANATLNSGTYSALMSQLQRGDISAADLAKIIDDSKGGLSGYRALMLENQATGEYEGVTGKLDYFIDSAVLGGLTIGGKLFNGHDGHLENLESVTGSTMDELKEQQKKIMSTKKDLNQQLNRLMLGDSLGTTDPDKLKEIEKAIQSGKDSDVRSLVGNNRAALNLADKYQSLVKQESEYGGDMDDLTSLTRYTTSLAQTGNQLAGLFKASDIMDKGEINSLLGDLRDRSKDIREKIKDGDISATEMYQFDQDTVAEVNEILKMMPQSDLKKLAGYLQETDKNAKLLDNGQLDVDKLQKYIINDVLHDGHVTEVNKEKKSKTTDGENTEAATKAAQEHQDAMYQFLSSYQQESQMLRDAVAGRTITNSKQSSIGTR